MAVSVLRWRYISDSGRQKLPEHRYSGTDNSLMYIYFCSPLADWLVQFFPLWLAPNVITLLGLAVSLLGYLVVQWHSPSFTEPCPSWVWFLAAWCTFTYQTLDNIDGKQARRTDSASPLGLFIDHGASTPQPFLPCLSLFFWSCETRGLFAVWFWSFFVEAK